MTANTSFMKYVRFLATGALIVAALMMAFVLATTTVSAQAMGGENGGSGSSIGGDNGTDGNNGSTNGGDNGTTGNIGGDNGTDGNTGSTGNIGGDNGTDGNTGGDTGGLGGDNGTDGNTGSDNDDDDDDNGGGRGSRGGGTSNVNFDVSGLSVAETGGAMILTWSTTRSATSWVTVDGVEYPSRNGSGTDHYASINLAPGESAVAFATGRIGGNTEVGPSRTITRSSLAIGNPVLAGGGFGGVGGAVDIGGNTTVTPGTSSVVGSTSTNPGTIANGTSTDDSDLAATAFFARPLTWILIVLALIILGIILYFWKRDTDEELPKA